MKRKIGCILMVSMLIGMLSGCGAQNSTAVDKMTTEELNAILCDGEYIFSIQNETIEIPDVKGEYHFLYLSDMHVIVPSEELAEKDVETVTARQAEFTNMFGETSPEIYQTLITNINQTDLDAVLMCGDMMDYLSKANWEFLKSGLDSLTVPYLYATADHDLSPWWTSYDKAEKAKLKESMQLKSVNSLEYDEFIILSVSESTSQLTEEALKEIKEIFAIGKPIVLMTHVPLEPVEDKTLEEISRTYKGDRNLVWGKGDYYDPDETTQAYLDMVYAEDSPVVAILSGHIHVRYEGMLNENTIEYVSNPAFLGEVNLVTIKGLSQ